MKKHQAVITNPEKFTGEPSEKVVYPDFVKVTLTEKHPMFNKKEKTVYTVNGKLAEKGVNSGQFKVI
jgi:hypothetical protein